MTNPAHKILLVDDNEVVSLTVSVLLEDEGYVVDTSLGLNGAREHLKNSSYDAVILDLNLDGECGLDLIPELRECAATTKIVVMTGDEAAAAGADADAVLAKAEDFSRLQHCLEEVLSKAGCPANDNRRTPPEESTAIEEAVVDPTPALSSGVTRSEALVELFLEIGNQDITALTEKADPSKARKLAHKLKGSATLLGFPRLRDACDSLENHDEETITEALSLHVETINLEFQTVREALVDLKDARYE